MFKIGESSLCLEVGRDLFDDVIIEAKHLIPTNESACFKFIRPNPALGLQHLDRVLRRDGGIGTRGDDYWVESKPAQLHCTNATDVGWVRHSREQKAQLLHGLGLEHGTNTTANCRNMPLAQFLNQGLGIVVTANKDADVVEFHRTWFGT